MRATILQVQTTAALATTALFFCGPINLSPKILQKKIYIHQSYRETQITTAISAMYMYF